MIRTGLLSLTVLACSTKPAPVVNQACLPIRAADPTAACMPLRTGAIGLPDLALVDVAGGLLVRCVAAGPCNVIADLRPKTETIPGPPVLLPAPDAEAK